MSGTDHIVARASRHLHEATRPLRETAAFRWLWISTLGSGMAQGVERTATAWLALETGGAFAVGLTVAARMAPALLFGLTAGTVADRRERRVQLMTVGFLALPTALLIAWLVGSSSVGVLGVVAIAFALGCLAVFDGPARQSLVLDTVSVRLATSAFALSALGSRIVMAAGALLAGALIATAGVPACFAAIGIAYGVSALAASRVQVAPRASETPHPSFRRALADAIRLFVDVPAIRIISAAGIAAEVFAFSNSVALPVLARDVLAIGPEGLGTLSAAGAIGATLVIATLAMIPPQVRREPLLGVTFLLYGLAIAALAISGRASIAVGVMLALGACGAAFDLLQQTLLQTALPAALRGRAAGIWYIGLGFGPVGGLEMGFLVATLGAPIALAINGIAVVACAIALLAIAPRYRLRSSQPPVSTPDRSGLE